MIAVLWLQKHSRAILLVLLALLGLSLGQMTATLLQIRLTKAPSQVSTVPETRREAPAVPELKDFTIIVQRNIFNAQTGDLSQFDAAEAAKDQPAVTSSKGQFKLLGTVAGEGAQLAVIQSGQEIEAYRLEESLPGGAKLVEIRRNQVDLQHTDGSRETLMSEQGSPGKGPDASPAARSSRSSSRAQPAAADQASAQSGIRSVGENRWEIPAQEAERARENINDLLRQARVEPNIVDGQTAGFAVRMIRPGSLFAMLGLRVGDVLREVNGVSLDSPEKALLIFQQLREARQINISLERDGQPVTFGYEIN